MKYAIAYATLVIALGMPFASFAMSDDMVPARNETTAPAKEQSAKEMNMDAAKHERALKQAKTHYQAELKKANIVYSAAMKVATKKKSKTLINAAKKKYAAAQSLAKKHYTMEKNAAMKGSTMKMK
ncbi:MAG: hypothetical protein AAB400_00120 [Patescibacteria group bacterium]|mgnify:CR=1 FL=1